MDNTKVFLKLCVFFATFEVILFGTIVYFFNMTSVQEIAYLAILAVVMFVVFAIRTWKNPNMPWNAERREGIQ